MSVVVDSSIFPLFIKRIICNELRNVKMFGHKNDPYVELNFGSWHAKTDVKEEAGAYAEWEELT